MYVPSTKIGEARLQSFNSICAKADAGGVAWKSRLAGLRGNFLSVLCTPDAFVVCDRRLQSVQVSNSSVRAVTLNLAAAEVVVLTQSQGVMNASLCITDFQVPETLVELENYGVVRHGTPFRLGNKGVIITSAPADGTITLRHALEIYPGQWTKASLLTALAGSLVSGYAAAQGPVDPFSEVHLTGGAGLPLTPDEVNTGPMVAKAHLNYQELPSGSLGTVNKVYVWVGRSNSDGRWVQESDLTSLIVDIPISAGTDIVNPMVDNNFTVSVIGTQVTIDFALSPIPRGTRFLVDIVRRGEDFDRETEILGITRTASMTADIIRSGIFDVRVQITDTDGSTVISSLTQPGALRLESLGSAVDPVIISTAFNTITGFLVRNQTGDFSTIPDIENLSGTSKTTIRKESVLGAVQAVPTTTPAIFQLQILNFETGLWETRTNTTYQQFTDDPFGFVSNSGFVIPATNIKLANDQNVQNLRIGASLNVIKPAGYAGQVLTINQTSGTLPPGASLSARITTQGIFASSSVNARIEVFLSYGVQTEASYTFSYDIIDDEGENVPFFATVEFVDLEGTLSPSIGVYSNTVGFGNNSEELGTVTFTATNTSSGSIRILHAGDYYPMAPDSDQFAPGYPVGLTRINDLDISPIGPGASTVFNMICYRQSNNTSIIAPGTFTSKNILYVEQMSGTTVVPGSRVWVVLPSQLTMNAQTLIIGSYPLTVGSGQTIDFSLSGSGFPDGTQVPWVIVPAPTLNSNAVSPASGTATFTGNQATVSVTIGSFTPGDQFRLRVGSDSFPPFTWESAIIQIQ